MTKPRHQSLRVWWKSLVGVIVAVDEKNLSLISAGVGFFGMLAIFPGLAAIIAIWGLVADPGVINGQMDLIRQFVPNEVFSLLNEQMDNLMTARPETLGWTTLLSIVAAFWSARAGVAALVRGLNAIYREPHRSGVYRIFSALAITGSLIMIAIVALLAVVVTPVLLAVLPLGMYSAWAVEVLRWFTAGMVLVIGLGVIYRLGPNRRAAKVAWISPGSILAVLLWVSVSMALSVYLKNFKSYNEVYGSIGAAISLLMWFYLSALSIFMGAALNAELELRTKEDSTIGPDRPMGERGAQVADAYIES